MPVNDISLIREAIKETLGCDSRHVESVRVTEKFQEQIAWDGTVEVFDLIDHPKAKRAYGWSFREGGRDRAKVVLGMSPADSPQNAVKVAIASKARKL
jgi:hypothetical protein